QGTVQHPVRSERSNANQASNPEKHSRIATNAGRPTSGRSAVGARWADAKFRFPPTATAPHRAANSRGNRRADPTTLDRTIRQVAHQKTETPENSRRRYRRRALLR